MQAGTQWHALPPTRHSGAHMKSQAFVMPLIAIIVGGAITAMMAYTWSAAPAGVLAVVLPINLIVLGLGVWFYTWLDRWEPEPPHFLVAAFVWGAGISILFASISNVIYLVSTENLFGLVVIAAPLSEETMKGLFLVLVLLLSRKGRAEFNSRVDAIVYAGFVGMGFTLIEDMDYVVSQSTAGEGIAVGILRVVSGTFLHAIFATLTALGLWKAVNAKGGMRFVWAFLGWLAAVFLHGLFNYTVSFVENGLFIGTAISLAATGSIVWLGIRSRKEEQQGVHQQLPVLVSHGWISANEAGWLASKPARKQRLSASKSRAERRLLSDFIQNVTELCLLRQRLDAQAPGPFNQEWIDNHAMLVGLVSLQRPEVDQLLGAGSWQQMQGRPGPGYAAELPSEQWAAPAGQPSAPMGRPSAPTNWPPAPASQSSAPANQPSAPSAHPPAPASRPSAPSEPPRDESNPWARPSND